MAAAAWGGSDSAPPQEQSTTSRKRQGTRCRPDPEEVFRAEADGLIVTQEPLDDFFYTALHDLKEPLRTLICYSTLLREDLGEDLSEAAAGDLKFITGAAQRMQRLLEDLLVFSRAGRKELKREQVDLGDCVQEALQGLRTQLNQTGAELRIADLPTVTGDHQSLTRLYQNLLSNAIKFSSKTPNHPVVELTAERKEEEWILGVRDSGIGIDPKYHQEIFSPFRRLHGVTEYEGTGVGLATCRKCIERHGGRIWVESEPGRGAWFRFALPAVKRSNTSKGKE